jgi:hypothetical protein
MGGEGGEGGVLSDVSGTASGSPDGGGEGGGGGGGGGSEFGAFLLNLLRERSGYILPFERELYGQGLEALRTGGIRAQIPMIQQALERSKQATSTALAETDVSLGQAGLKDTVFGQRIRGGLTLAGKQNANQIPTDLASKLIGGILGVLPSATGQLTSGAAEGYRSDVAQALGELQAATGLEIAQLDAATRLQLGNLGSETELEIARRRERALSESRTYENVAKIGGSVGTVLSNYGRSSGSSGGGKGGTTGSPIGGTGGTPYVTDYTTPYV